MGLDRPIPAFYCCYLLRSTVRHGSVYVGSTPNPVRRLRQHNGLAKGGAVRTSRNTLRPWEMSCIVTGFPSHIAALQFEWAWQNPHLTLHIPAESRLTQIPGHKRSGRPKRPRHTVTSLLSNLHLLLRVQSFARWPLELRFFSQDVHKAWLRWCKAAATPLRESIVVHQDFLLISNDDTASQTLSSPSKKGTSTSVKTGISALCVDYSDRKPHVEKAKQIVDFELEGACKLCKENLQHDGGIYAICPSPDCTTVTHLSCLSQHFLDSNDDLMVPVTGRCPGCQNEIRWVDVGKEITLRMRGEKELQTLLKVRKPRKIKASTQAAIESEIVEEDDESDAEAEAADMEAEMEMLDQFDQDVDPSSDEDIDSASHHEPAITRNSGDQNNAKKVGRLTSKTVIQDSDWEDAIEL